MTILEYVWRLEVDQRSGWYIVKKISVVEEIGRIRGILMGFDLPFG